MGGAMLAVVMLAVVTCALCWGAGAVMLTMQAFRRPTLSPPHALPLPKKEFRLHSYPLLMPLEREVV